MYFNDKSNLEKSILHDVSFLTGADNGVVDADLFVDYPLEDRVRSANAKYGEIALYILMANFRHKWDDPNWLKQPTFEFDLTKGNGVYTIAKADPDANQDWLFFDRVELVKENDDMIVLTPFDLSDTDTADDELLSTDSTPIYYNFDGSSIHLKPALGYDKTRGLRIYPARNPSYFDKTATTKRPGFATPLHRALSFGMAIDFCLGKPDLHSLIPGYTNEYVKLVGDPLRGVDGLLQHLYGNINRYEHTKIGRKQARRI